MAIFASAAFSVTLKIPSVGLMAASSLCTREPLGAPAPIVFESNRKRFLPFPVFFWYFVIVHSHPQVIHIEIRHKNFTFRSSDIDCETQFRTV